MADNFLSKVLATGVRNAMRGSAGGGPASGGAVGDAMKQAMGGSGGSTDVRSALNQALKGNGGGGNNPSGKLATDLRQSIGEMRGQATKHVTGSFNTVMKGAPDQYEAARAQERERTKALVSGARKTATVTAGYGWRSARWVGGKLLGALGGAMRGLARGAKR